MLKLLPYLESHIGPLKYGSEVASKAIGGTTELRAVGVDETFKKKEAADEDVRLNTKEGKIKLSTDGMSGRDRAEVEQAMRSRARDAETQIMMCLPICYCRNQCINPITHQQKNRIWRHGHAQC